MKNSNFAPERIRCVQQVQQLCSAQTWLAITFRANQLRPVIDKTSYTVARGLVNNWMWLVGSKSNSQSCLNATQQLCAIVVRCLVNTGRWLVGSKSNSQSRSSATQLLCLLNAAIISCACVFQLSRKLCI